MVVDIFWLVVGGGESGFPIVCVCVGGGGVGVAPHLTIFFNPSPFPPEKKKKTVTTKHSILDIAAALDLPPIIRIKFTSQKCNLPYRIAENVRTSSKCPALQNKSNPVVSLTDCKHHLEMYVISFVVENSLSSIPKLIEFARNLSSDHNCRIVRI